MTSYLVILTAFLFMFPVDRMTALEKLPEKYIVSYGKPDASKKIVKYYTFMCPHCVALFRKEFKEINEKFVEKELISYSFHPVPKDLLTVSAMDCLEKLEGSKKQAFLEVMLEEVDTENSEYSLGIMKKAMEILGTSIPNLGEKNYMSETNAFKDAFKFISQDESISAVPSVEVNGKLYEREIPDLEFLKTVIGEINRKSEETTISPASVGNILGGLQ